MTTEQARAFTGSAHTTPAQTIGPFFALGPAGSAGHTGKGILWDDGPLVVPEGAPNAFRIEGRVLDGLGEPVPDAVVETWQADPDGRFDHPDDPRGAVRWKDFRGFGRSATDVDGRYGVLTVKPGPLPVPEGGWEAPHVNVSLFCRGMLVRLVTRIYFPDEEANAHDPVLNSLDPAVRATLIAAAVPSGYHFDIHLQGEHETVFFDL